MRRWRSWAGAGDAEGRVLAARPAELTPKTRGTEDGLRLLDAFPPGPDTPAAVASAHHLARGVLYFVADRYEEGVAAARTAQEAAEPVTGPERRGLPAGRWPGRRRRWGSPAGSVRRGRSRTGHVPHAEAYGDPQLPASVLSVLRETAGRTGRLREAIDTGRRALALAERSGDPTDGLRPGDRPGGGAAVPGARPPRGGGPWVVRSGWV